MSDAAGEQMDFRDGPSIDEALRLLRADRCGALQFGEHVRPIKFVIDNETGALVAPVMTAVMDHLDCTLFTPEESDEALQLLVTPDPIDPDRHAGADRWRIYHGEPIDVRWVSLHIDSAKLGAMVYDGEALMVPNPLAAAEPGICKRLNADRDKLRSLCLAAAHVEVDKPVAVGVDPDGLDVRARFGIVRIEFAARVSEESEALRAIESLLVKEAGA